MYLVSISVSKRIDWLRLNVENVGKGLEVCYSAYCVTVDIKGKG